MNKKEKEQVKKLSAHKLKKMKEAKTAVDMIKTLGIGFEGDEGDPGHNEYAEKSIFAKLLPDIFADYGNTPHIHMTERGELHPKIKALIHIACHSMIGHWGGIPHGAVTTKQWGATNEEILESSSVAIIANAKAKMVEVDQVMTMVFNDPAFKNAKDRTK